MGRVSNELLSRILVQLVFLLLPVSLTAINFSLWLLISRVYLFAELIAIQLL